MTQLNIPQLTEEEKLRLYTIAKQRWIDVGVNDNEKDKIVDAFLYALEMVCNAKTSI